jgi:murein L,D-transpeptidase YcbB/YkuD
MQALENPYYNYKQKKFSREIIDQYSHLLHNNMDLNQNSDELAKLDIALTQSYIALANFIVNSDIDWDKVQEKLHALKESKDISAHWEMVRKTPPSADQLFNALVNEEISQFFKSLTPLKERHKALINALLFYQNMREVPKVHYGEVLKYGDRDERIIEVKERLAISGDFPRKAYYSDLFDDQLKEALAIYKDRFNLEKNGLIDKITIYYMNKPIKLLVDDIITNLDKLKVFPNQFPKEVVMVNIPDFRMDYYKNGYSVLSMNAVVGRDERPTPIFASDMTYLELNPNWNIPENLVRRDLIPALTEHPNYLKEHNIHVFKGWGKKSKDLQSTFTVDKLLPYKEKSAGHIPYRFVQYPGEDNALGRIKFMFPNKYSVYLHDTDNKELLTRRYRVYSSGCMRLQHPFKLLDMLKPRLKVSSEKIEKYLASGKTKTLRFTKKLPVQTLYFTVFQRNGLIYFRKDIYQYDKFIRQSLKDENLTQESLLY